MAIASSISPPGSARSCSATALRVCKRRWSSNRARLLQSLGDVHPSDVKVRLLERLTALAPGAGWQGILGQSGADALSAALKTAVLHTGKPGVIAFAGAYHGLSYGPLSLCGLRESYRAPFAEQLNAAVRFIDYPLSDAALQPVLHAVRAGLASGDVGAVVFEPILGRGGVFVPPAPFGAELGALCREFSSLLVADEVWTGLGRSGEWLFSTRQGARPDIICLGKGLGGGIPISACLGRPEVMAAWSQPAEVVHTSTFAGAPLGCATALATLHALESGRLVERSEAPRRRALARARPGARCVCARSPGRGTRGRPDGGHRSRRRRGPRARRAAEVARSGLHRVAGGRAPREHRADPSSRHRRKHCSRVSSARFALRSKGRSDESRQ